MVATVQAAGIARSQCGDAATPIPRPHHDAPAT